MKIGILTFHRSINYGAVTQCYSLAIELKKRFPDDTIEVIDYVPQFRVRKYEPSLWQYLFGNVSYNSTIVLNTKLVLSKAVTILTNPDAFRLLKPRHRAFVDSMWCLPLSIQSYRQDDSELFRKEIYGKYDIIVVGSDCVWEWSTVPIPNAYYLCGDYGAKKVSFAASVGTDNFRILSGEEQALIAASIADFSYIGVRDTSTEYVVKQACPRAMYYHNCDPTTFLDISLLEKYRQSAKDRLLKAGITFEKPVIGIMCNEKLGRLARDIFGDSVQYIGLYIPNRYCDVNFLDLEVLEWAAIFGLFDMTFTTFFHGTMLSLVNLTPVLSFDYLPETDEQHTKLHELYDRLELPGFYHRDKPVYTAEDVKQLKKISEKFLREPPKELIRRELEKEARHGESFFEYLQSLHK